MPIIQNGVRYWVPCQKCNFCLQTRRNHWAFRLTEEHKSSVTAHFLTLTYDNQHLPILFDEEDIAYDWTLKKSDLSQFHDTIKKAQKRYLGAAGYNQWGKIRFYSVGEYGTRSGRPHYHSIIFNLFPEMVEKLADGYYWDKGRVHIGNVTPDSCAYVAKYVIDRIDSQDRPNEKQKEYATMSRNPGIGHDYLIRNKNWHMDDNDYNPDNIRMYAIQNGKKVSLPRYYKDRIFKAADESVKQLIDESLTKYYDNLSNKFEKEYIREIERLAKLHPEPVLYYRQRRKAHHDSIRIKSHQKNKL